MQVDASGTPREKGPGALAIVFVLWLSLTFAGMAGLWLYSTAPGKEGAPPDRWPAFSSLRRTPGVSTPLCSCIQSVPARAPALANLLFSSRTLPEIFVHRSFSSSRREKTIPGLTPIYGATLQSCRQLWSSAMFAVGRRAFFVWLSQAKR